MAEAKNTNTETTTQQTESNTVEQQTETNTVETEPTVNDLMAKIARLEAENAKQKNAINKATRERGEAVKQLRERMNADEVAAEEKREAAEAQKAYVESLEREVALNKAVQRYTAMGMELGLAKETAEFELNGDMDALTANCKKFTEETVKTKEAEWLATRPQANVGVESKCPITREQFNKMGYTKRKEFKEKYPEMYEKYR